MHHPQLASGERPKGDDYGLAAVVRVNVALPGKGSVELDAGASELCQPGMLQPLHWQSMFLRRVADAAPCRALIAESFARVLLGQRQLHRGKKELCGIRPEGILAAAFVSNHHAVPIRVWPWRAWLGFIHTHPHPQMVLVLNRVGRSALLQHEAEGKPKSQGPPCTGSQPWEPPKVRPSLLLLLVDLDLAQGRRCGCF